MIKKISIKTVTVFILLTSLLIIFFNYSKKENVILKDSKKNIEEVSNNSNLIKDLFYSSKDLKENEYSIYAKEGEIDLDNNNIIFLEDVTAYIKLKEKNEIIKITSNYGKYNSINYDTIFSKNVKIDYIDNVITGEYLDFSMIKNILMISRNVVYKNPKNTLVADVMEMDIKTKDTKIFMYNSSEQVKVENIN